MTGFSPAKLFDLQVNGFAGVDFQQPDLQKVHFEEAIASLHRYQTSQVLVALITDRVDSLCAKLVQLERYRRASARVAETVVGYHLEGPYLRAEAGFHGPHPPHLMKAPETDEFDRLHEASGENIRLVTIAPELPGSAEFIEHVTARGVRVAIGHSDADERTIDDAIKAGLSLCTHVGNGVPIRVHRHDNIIQRLLARDELYAVFIPDGLHVPQMALRNFVRAKPVDKVLFTTDCMAAAGAPEGRYRLGNIETVVGADRIVREPGKENFAGSALTMDVAVENVCQFLGWSRKDAVTACSDRVADALGVRRA